jgi:AraC-like DNA-binding protein
MEDAYPKMYLYRRIVQAKMFIDRNFASHIDADNICGEASFSKFHFIRLFRQVYGRTPHRYLTWVRIENAKTLLQQGKPVAEVCGLVGFDSAGTFSTLFKRMTGKSPAAFRAACARQKEAVAAQPLSYVPGCFARMNGWLEEKQF